MKRKPYLASLLCACVVSFTCGGERTADSIASRAIDDFRPFESAIAEDPKVAQVEQTAIDFMVGEPGWRFDFAVRNFERTTIFEFPVICNERLVLEHPEHPQQSILINRTHIYSLSPSEWYEAASEVISMDENNKPTLVTIYTVWDGDYDWPAQRKEKKELVKQISSAAEEMKDNPITDELMQIVGKGGPRLSGQDEQRANELMRSLTYPQQSWLEILSLGVLEARTDSDWKLKDYQDFESTLKGRTPTEAEKQKLAELREALDTRGRMMLELIENTPRNRPASPDGEGK